MNSGQVCVGAKRVIVQEAVYDAFIQELLAAVQPWTTGDPLGEKTMLGPLARYDLYEKVVRQVQQSVQMGARVLYGDVAQLKKLRTPAEGNYFSSMILDQIPVGAPAREGIRGDLARRRDLRAVSGAVQGAHGRGSHPACQQQSLRTLVNPASSA